MVVDSSETIDEQLFVLKEEEKKLGSIFRLKENRFTAIINFDGALEIHPRSHLRF